MAGQALGYREGSRPCAQNPVADPRRLVFAGLVLAALLGIAALGAVWLAKITVNDVATEGEVARATAAFAALTSEGAVPGPAMELRLQRDFLLEGAHFVVPGAASGREASVPAGAGMTLAWTPRLLGNELVAQLAPIRLLVSAGILGTIIFVLARLYRLAIQLEGLRRAARAAADRDALTRVASRLAFEEGLRAAFQHGEPERLALLYLDLDDFKGVNDGFGHAAGDALLRQVADRLRAAARPDDLVARLGGDEFAILRPDAGSRSDLARDVADLSRRLSLPYRIGGIERGVRVSIGAAICPEDAHTAEALVRAADRALYRVKADRTLGYAFVSTVPATPTAALPSHAA